MADEYNKFRENELILRDELAIARTHLANERTLMAYLRTGLALMIAGASIIHFTEKIGWFMVVGMICIPLGIAVGAFGIWRFRKVRSQLARPPRRT